MADELGQVVSGAEVVERVAASGWSRWSRRWLPEADAGERAAQLVIALVCWGILGLSFWLEPAASGIGTHEQLGFAPCGFYVGTGMPCPACGMTTSFSLMAHGRLISAFAAQPAGAVMALLVSLGAVVLPVMAWRGRSLRLLIGRVYPGMWAMSLGVLVRSEERRVGKQCI